MKLKDTYIQVGLGLAAAWLFTALSLIVSFRGTDDWFSRSGAVLCLMAATANFVLVRVHQRDLAQIFKDKERSGREKAEAILKPPETYLRLARISYLTGFVGTAIWGYGDLLL